MNLESHKVTVRNVNFRKEVHGEDEIAACDINLEIKGNQDLLGVIGPQVDVKRWADVLWDDQGRLRLEHVKEIALEYEATGCRMALSKTPDKKGVEIDDVRVKKFRVIPAEGKALALRFQVQAYPARKDRAELVEWINDDIYASIINPQMDFDDVA